MGRGGHVSTLRSDAARNRRALIEAARTAFGRNGLDTPLDEIARQAGIGNATLYRHFSTRQALVAAVYGEAMTEILAAAEAALEVADPWEGFAAYVRFVCRLQAENRGLADLLIRRFETEPDIEQLRERAAQAVERVVRRAKEAGTLRDDFAPEDFTMLLMSNAGLVYRAGDAGPTASARVVSFLLDGLRREAASGAPPSPGRKALRDAMASFGRRPGAAVAAR